MHNQKLAVSEYFYSLQGEGRTMGRPAIFLRLAGCNLMCGGAGTERDGKLHDGATWRCDTIEVWMKGETRTIPDLFDELNSALNFAERLRAGVHLVITGGEPLLQQDRILMFLLHFIAMTRLHPIVEIETNATIIPSKELNHLVLHWNTSPKLSNSGMSLDARRKPEVLEWFKINHKTTTKFVISCPEDWDEIQRDFLDTGLVTRHSIVLMPAADSFDSLIEANKMVAEICKQHQVQMSTRLHVAIWNQLTGV